MHLAVVLTSSKTVEILGFYCQYTAKGVNGNFQNIA